MGSGGLELAHGLSLSLDRPRIVGILNITPDSFSDGGRFEDVGGLDVVAAVAEGRRLFTVGADIVDVGGESTRPGAAQVSENDEIARVVPIIAELSKHGLVSVDTSKSGVARAAIEAGAALVNDISGGLFDSSMVGVVAELNAGYVLGHVRGGSISEVHAGESTPLSVAEVEEALRARLDAVPSSMRQRTIVDPGLGFGKNAALNLELTRNSGTLALALQLPVMIGASRKRYLGELTGRPVSDRDDATLGASLAAIACGAAFVRVHAVERMKAALVAFEASFAPRSAVSTAANAASTKGTQRA